MDKLIYGKNTTENVVSIEHHGNEVTLYIEEDGIVRTQNMPARYWTLYAQQPNRNARKLEGNLHYKWCLDFMSRGTWTAQLANDRSARRDYYAVYNDKESYLVRSGVTYYKGMSIDDVSVMAFDIETNGLTMDAGSQVFCISAIFSLKGQREERVFEDPKEFFSYVHEKNPSILVGHNIFGFDLPYLDHFCGGIPVGRNGSKIRFAKKPSRVRKDQGQQYDYFNALCTGREIIDTFHLALKVGQFKGYDNYSIKTIAKHEGIAKEDRQYYDAANIGKMWEDEVEREKIKQYAIDDTQEVLDYFYKVAPAYFYYTQSVPKSFQQIISGATGSQVNSVLTRAYVQEHHSIPKASDQVKFQGAISKGNPGLYRNVYKVDVASLYPSIIMQYDIYDRDKDPKNYFGQMVRTFTQERLKNKALAKETGEKIYTDLEQSQKIMINSAYGFMGAKGLNFNSPENAALVTEFGRKVLNAGLEWAEEKGYGIVNVDTDSFSYVGSDDFSNDLGSLNERFPEQIKWEDDGHYDSVLVVKAKNYVLQEGSKLKIKGSALKATTKEPALKEFIDRMIGLFLQDETDSIEELYNEYVREIMSITDITRWCTKKTVTKSVLKPKRTNERLVLEALQGSSYKEGDKVYVFYDTDSTLCLKENYEGLVSQDRLLRKLFMTYRVFEPVLDSISMPNYALKGQKTRLEQLCNHSLQGAS